MSDTEKPHRAIRSFVRREGRITAAQQRAMAELLPHYAVPAGDDVLDLKTLFGRQAPVQVEIGFGNGEALVAMALAHPEKNYLGIEVHRPGVGILLRQVEALGLTNVRVCNDDATPFFARRLRDAAVDGICIFFPDPWPKKRHHKRRLVQPDFMALLRRKLKLGGSLHLATDWQDYAEQMLEVLSAVEGLRNSSGPGQFAVATGLRPPTKFERRGRRLGHAVWDLVYERTS